MGKAAVPLLSGVVFTLSACTYIHNLNFLSSSPPRRMIFQLHPGKNLVLIREDYSDILDFVTCMCLHSIEAEKCRHKISSPVCANMSIMIIYIRKHMPHIHTFCDVHVFALHLGAEVRKQNTPLNIVCS